MSFGSGQAWHSHVLTPALGGWLNSFILSLNVFVERLLGVRHWSKNWGHSSEPKQKSLLSILMITSEETCQMLGPTST